MGNNSSREGRRGSDGPQSQSSQPESTSRQGAASNSTRGSGNRRSNRHDLSFFGLTSNSTQAPPERRETRQEREKRKLEKERAARIQERERSIREEHVDGGYLVTMGVYVGTEDFSKAIVRHLMIERQIAPFWRGLDDFSETWAEHQVIAAARGLPIPDPDEIPPQSASSQDSTPPPIAGPNPSTSHPPTSTRASPSSHPAALNTSIKIDASPSQSPIHPRTKSLAILTKSTQPVELLPQEIRLPHDPNVNGQAIELFLYKDSEECPICFLFYPPYLNKTRCCGQPICSECFVQIKRPDPHPPEHTDPGSPVPTPEVAAEAEMLISEPATCPYCQQPDFGVTYSLPPPFRRGLAYAGTTIKASSPVTSLASNTDEGRAIQTPQSGRRRTISVSASAPGVITTDIIRPEWATKLATARNHMARRSAAATALHTAAYLIGDGSNSRSFSFASRSRFARSRSGDASVDPAELSPTGDAGGDFPQLHTEARPTQRRSRVDDIEEMMVMEAIRLSLAAEEERNRQTEKQAVKDAKKKAKEDKKHEKLQEKRDRKDRRSVYGGNSLSGSGSALSLSLSGIGRRRNNSGGSNMAREPTLEGDASNEGKGKAVDRGSVSSSVHGNNGSWPLPQTLTTSLPASSEASHSATSPTAPERPSHLRTVSNASNMSNSSSENSTRDKGMNFTAGSSGLGGLPTPDFSGSDPLFNYDALARMISRGEEAEPIIDYPMASSIDTSATPMQRAEGQDASTVQPDTSLPGREVPRPVLLAATPEMPELKVTPETPVLPAQQYA